MCSPAPLPRAHRIWSLIKQVCASIIRIDFCEFSNNIHLSRVGSGYYKTQYRTLPNDRADSGLKRSPSTSTSAKIGQRKMTIELEPGFPVVPSARTGEASRPPPRERSVRVRFPALRSMADATDAMAAISDAVASDAIRPGEAAELSRFVKASIRRSTLAGSFSGSWLLRQNSSDDTASRHRRHSRLRLP